MVSIQLIQSLSQPNQLRYSPLLVTFVSLVMVQVELGPLSQSDVLPARL